MYTYTVTEEGVSAAETLPCPAPAPAAAQPPASEGGEPPPPAPGPRMALLAASEHGPTVLGSCKGGKLQSLLFTLHTYSVNLNLMLKKKYCFSLIAVEHNCK